MVDLKPPYITWLAIYYHVILHFFTLCMSNVHPAERAQSLLTAVSIFHKFVDLG